MKNFVRNTKLSIDTEIKRIEQTGLEPPEKIRLIVSFIQSSMNELKSFTSRYQFESPEEEILFFKEWKPGISGLLLYYVRLYDIENKCTGKSAYAQCAYLKKEDRTLKEKLSGNEFYSYYRTGKIHHDKDFFLRESYNILNDTNCLSFEKDHSFTTIHDFSVAEILANHMLSDYISSRIETLSGKLYLQLVSCIEGGTLQWTDSKVALVEFIYALHACGSFNHGMSHLKDIAFCFEILFNIEVGDFYRIFLEIRGRKKNRTQFLDKMRDALIGMMDGLDK